MLLSSKKQYQKRSTTRTTAEFIKLALAVHGNTYIYDKSVYDTCNTKITITCRTHGDFMQLAKNHLKGVGCHKCKTDKQSGITTQEFINLARKVHGDTYLYDKTEYKRTRELVTVTCREHGDFKQTASNHLAGQGCAKCASRRRSKTANQWLDSLKIAEDCRELTIKEFSRRPVDAYVAETNTVYQFHGDYWHGNAEIYEAQEFNVVAKKTMGELYESTLAWDKQIRDLNYNLVVMWENDYKKQLKS